MVNVVVGKEKNYLVFFTDSQKINNKLTPLQREI